MVQGIPNFYTGEFRHSLDSKNRLTIPSKWRSKGEKNKDDQFVLIPTPGGYITALPPAQVQEYYDKISKSGLGEPKKLAAIRALFGKADSVTCDSQGRVGITSALLKHAGIRDGNDAVMVGMVARFEIWNADSYATNISDEDINEALRDIGI